MGVRLMARFNAWRNNGRPARFWLFDARAGIGLMVFMLHWSAFTLKVALISFVTFGLLERFGFSVTVAGRWARSRLAGPVRQSTPWWRRHRNDQN